MRQDLGDRAYLAVCITMWLLTIGAAFVLGALLRVLL